MKMDDDIETFNHSNCSNEMIFATSNRYMLVLYDATEWQLSLQHHRFAWMLCSEYL